MMYHMWINVYMNEHMCTCALTRCFWNVPCTVERNTVTFEHLLGLTWTIQDQTQSSESFVCYASTDTFPLLCNKITDSLLSTAELFCERVTSENNHSPHTSNSLHPQYTKVFVQLECPYHFHSFQSSHSQHKWNLILSKQHVLHQSTETQTVYILIPLT